MEEFFMVVNRKKMMALVAVMAMGSSLAVLADAGTPPSASAPAPSASVPAPVVQHKAHHAHHPDMWMQHSQAMLLDMKEQLNLTAAQLEGWKAWSGDVLSITQAQTERIHHWRAEHEKKALEEDRATADHARVSTPERMAHGLDHMRLEVERLQDHLALLEKLQASTQKFYDTLDTNQKTIFDLYWQQAYAVGSTMGHPMCGHGEGMGMGMGGMMMHPPMPPAPPAPPAATSH
ncbi:conserved hypothetical protein, secreted [mine drainage metagenome]|jgi:hydrogenase maturation factor HypF (carbamoyltransferase family)